MKFCIIPAVILVIGLGARPAAFAQDDVTLYACDAQAVWTNCADGQSIDATARQPETLHLLAHVSRPAAECLRAWIDLTASYLAPTGDVLCTGTLDRIATLTAHTQELTFQLAPGVLRTFARWTNEPGRRADPPFEPLQCLAADGRTELLDTHLEGASAIEITAAVLPASGGVGIARCRLEMER